MKETIIQLIMLALAAVSCYGYFRRAEKLFDLRAEFAVFISFTALGLTMLLAGVLGILVPAAYTLFALGLALAVWSIVRREGLKDFLKPGVVFMLLCCGFFFVLLYGSKLTHIDNYSHWGAILKMIIQRDALPANEPLVYFPAYPTGSSLLIYYFVRITGIQAEWFWSYIQAVYLASCAATLFCFADYDGRAERWAARILAAFVGISLLCADIDPADLLVDTLIPMIALAGTAMCVYYRNKLSSKAIPIIITVCFLPMVKNSGYLFSTFIIVLSLCLSRGTARRRLAVAAALSLLGINRIWAWHVKAAFSGGMASYHALSAESFQSSFAEKTAADLLNITRAYLDAVASRGRLPWLFLCIAAVVFIICRSGKWRQLRGFVFAGAGVWLAWVLGILGMYFFSMSLGEALGLAAFERYYASALIFCGGYFFILCMLALDEKPSALMKAAALLCCALCVVTAKPNYTYLERQSLRDFRDLEMRNRVDALIEENNIPSGLAYFVFSGDYDDVTLRAMVTYLLQPTTTHVCPDDELGQLDDGWRSYDYYIVADETEANMAFVRDAMAKDAPVGYTW